MKKNILINPYIVLGISQSASTAEITKATATAMKRKQFPIDVIAKAQKSLINPQKRILADYLSPILPIIQRFKRQDYSDLNSPAPSLDFLAQFDNLDLTIEQSHSIASSDEILGQKLFSSVSSTDLSCPHSNELENGYINIGQLSEAEQPFNTLILPALDPLEIFPETSLLPSPKAQMLGINRGKNAWLLRALALILLAAITFLASIMALTSARSGTLNSTSSEPQSLPPVTISTQSTSAEQSFTPSSVRSIPDYESLAETPSNAISTTSDQNSELKPAPTPPPLPETTVQRVSIPSFPADTCGDRNPGGTNMWYPVYVNYSESNLSLIRSRYCRDAIRKYRESLGLHSIQIASFLNRVDAQDFAVLLKSEIGSGEVGEPGTYNFDTPALVSPNTLQQKARYNFPANTCGDRDPGGTNIWYPVYVNYSERNFSLVKDRYCRDAVRNYRENIGLHSIQIASFLSQANAQEFAALMRHEVGSGEVGVPKRF